jgi:hypothetical protein
MATKASELAQYGVNIDADRFIKLPSVTSTERDTISAQSGMLIYNSTEGRIEQYTNTWTPISSLPSANSVSPTTFNGDAGTVFTINGANFDQGISVTFIGNDGTEYVASSVTFISGNQITATTPVDFTVANEPYDVKVISGAGLSGILIDAIDAGGLPTWTSSAGSLGTFNYNENINTTISATDPEGGDVDYTLTGSLPAGVSFDGETGQFSGSAPDLDDLTTYNFSIVPDDGVNNGSSRAFSITVNGNRDVYFNTTGLLISGDNILENIDYPAISDSSDSFHEMIAHGSTYGTEFSPYNTNWAVEFGGVSSSDTLSVSSSSGWNFTGDFTIEAWVKLNEIPNDYIAISVATITNGYWFGHLTTGWGLRRYGVVDIVQNPQLPVVGKWQHVAVSRSGTTLRCFVDGVLVDSANDSQNWETSALVIGSDGTPGSQFQRFPGQISNFRIVKGTALYTGNFTPSTSKLTAVSGTSILTLQDRNYVDNSGNNHTITRAGTPKSVSSGPFTESDTTTGSVILDSSYNDYISIPNSADFDFSSQEYTVEAWVRGPFTGGITSSVVFNKSVGGAASDSSFYFGCGTDGVSHYVSTSGTSWTNYVQQSTTEVNDGAWHHVVWQRDKTANQLQIFIDGTLRNSVAFNDTIATSTREVNIGRQNTTGSSQFNGYISDLRVVKGQALYSTGGYTVPSAPNSKITDTKLLTFQNRGEIRNSGILDSAKPNREIEVVGDVVQGTISPYGERWGVDLNNTSGWIEVEDSTALDLTAEFTIECWMKQSQYGPTMNNRIFQRGSNSVTGYCLLTRDDGNVKFGRTDEQIVGFNQNLNDSKWHHYAVTRDSNNVVRLYFDGVLKDSATMTDILNQSGALYIGRYPGDTANRSNSVFSDFRIVKGSALYTGASFNPPTSKLTAVSGTVLLTLQDNKTIDNSSSGLSVTTNNGAKVVPDSPYYSSSVYTPATYGGSAYFDGSDNLTIPTSDEFNLGLEDFTIEFWAWLNPYIANGASSYWANIVGINVGASDANTVINTVGIWQGDGTGTSSVAGEYTIIISGDSTNQERLHSGISGYNRWSHVVLTRENGTFKLWQDGVLTDSVTTSANISRNDYVSIGRSINSFIKGYISDLRIVKGTALYTGTFTPPSSPVSVTDTTVCKLDFTNTGIYDSTKQHLLKLVGQSRITSAQKKYGTGSIYVDGSGDYVQTVGDNRFGDLGTGDFTVEFWVKMGAQNTHYSGIGTLTSNNVGSWRVILAGWGNRNNVFFATYTNTFNDYLTNNTTINDNVWHHVAVTRENGLLRGFVDGIIDAGNTHTVSESLSSGNEIYIGAETYSPTFMSGYFDDIRITKGIARYTSNFTPPTGSFKKR